MNNKTTFSYRKEEIGFIKNYQNIIILEKLGESSLIHPGTIRIFSKRTLVLILMDVVVFTEDTAELFNSGHVILKGSLRHILSTRQDKRLLEEFIAIVLRTILDALRVKIHNRLIPRAHKTLSDEYIFIHTTSGQTLTRLAYEASVYDSEKINVKEDIKEDSNEEAGSSSSAFFAPKRIAK
ncbi:hypothetical protein FXO38_34269 [Capsicum annuum]|uniref:Uncharacterized protein n=1 Tax=Capsicum annuum TaxID=4072 RepID=A0A2G2ZNF2_CAPAN|nr:hypothetical protein FXO38_34269 [Capsicum annuum]KAF3619456.1 hypothetical protein FXO37_33677 [Capsicum annuum]PHT83517.1 hypothetical protein T459_11960 [Capsicum annuum]